MLTLTENASAIVNEITHQPGLAETAGLRITSDHGPGAGVRDHRGRSRPSPATRSSSRPGRPSTSTPSAAALLDDKVLDAAVDPSGKVEFALALQG